MSGYHKNPEWALTWPDLGSWFPRRPSGEFLLVLVVLIWLLAQWANH